MIDLDRLRKFAPNCPLVSARTYASVLEAGRVKAGLITPLRVCHFMAQVAHESGGFTRLVENLNYSADRLTQVWPSRFPTHFKAQPYANNPRALGDYVYGGRLGNTLPGDGYNYRGRGLIQLTGRANYRAAATATGLDLEGSPDLVADPDHAATVALWFWSSRNLNDEADRDDLDAITRAINGGLEGLNARAMWLTKAKGIFR